MSQNPIKILVNLNMSQNKILLLKQYLHIFIFIYLINDLYKNIILINNL